MSDLRELYQEVILDHSRNPRHFGKLEPCTAHSEGFNPLCGDRLQLYLRVENNRIIDAKFEGSGCAISTASASLMTDVIIGKNREEAELIFEQFRQMLTESQMPTSEWLDKLAIFAGVKEFPMRVKCATLAWHTLHAALSNTDKTVTTE
jgi:nitrogen fixation NifU-like protein